jgi:heptosyltransferase-2
VTTGDGAILAFLPNWIGDVVMATPALRALRDHFPNRPLVAVAKPYVAETLAGLPWFADTVMLGRGIGDFATALRKVRRHKPTAAVLFPNSFRPALLARLAGCTTVAGFARYLRHPLLTHRLYPKRGPGGSFRPTPALDDYNRVVERLGVPDPGTRMELATTAADELAADRAWANLRLNRFRRVVGVNPGGAFGASKHWPAEHFAAAARELTASVPGLAVVVLCGPSERAQADSIVSLAYSGSVVSMSAEPPSVGLTKAVVRRLSLLLTTDSGPRHFAAAFGVPVVTLFGPTHVGWTETYFGKAIHVQKDVPCGPCQRRVCPLGHHRCMTELTPADAVAPSLQLLTRFTTDGHPEARRHAG